MFYASRCLLLKALLFSYSIVVNFVGRFGKKVRVLGFIVLQSAAANGRSYRSSSVVKRDDGKKRKFEHRSTAEIDVAEKWKAEKKSTISSVFVQ